MLYAPFASPCTLHRPLHQPLHWPLHQLVHRPLHPLLHNSCTDPSFCCFGLHAGRDVSISAAVSILAGTSVSPSSGGGATPLYARDASSILSPNDDDSSQFMYGSRAASGVTWLSGLFDRGSWVESQCGWARTVVTGRARLAGTPVGVIAVETQVESLNLTSYRVSVCWRVSSHAFQGWLTCILEDGSHAFRLAHI